MPLCQLSRICTVKEPCRRNEIRHCSTLPVSDGRTDELGRGDTVIGYVKRRHAVRRQQPGNDK